MQKGTLPKHIHDAVDVCFKGIPPASLDLEANLSALIDMVQIAMKERIIAAADRLLGTEDFHAVQSKLPTIVLVQVNEEVRVWEQKLDAPQEREYLEPSVTGGIFYKH